MSENRLEIRDVHVTAEGRSILRDINLVVEPGEVHVLLGPNGSGKSTLLAAIMGMPPYQVSAGEILYRSETLNYLPIDERARLGLGMAFQRPPNLEGVRVCDFHESINAEENYGREVAALDLEEFTERDINVGFSGGEIKRWEVLKLFLQAPQMLLFDEPESGVDLEHIAAMGEAINRLARSSADGEPRSALIITHTGFILDYVEADVGHVMVDGRILRSGQPRELFTQIQRHGYDWIPSSNSP